MSARFECTPPHHERLQRVRRGAHGVRRTCGSEARTDFDRALSGTARRGRGIDDRSGHGISLRSTEPDRRHLHGQIDGRRPRSVRAIDNDVRSDRTRAGMKAALELGRWVFLAPIGFLNAPRATGKSLTHDPERAPLVRRAFEEYATGRFTMEQLLKHARAWGLTNRRGRLLTSQAIGMLLRISCTRESWTCPSMAFVESVVTSSR